MRKEIKMIVFVFVLMLGAFVYCSYSTSTECHSTTLQKFVLIQVVKFAN